MKKTKKAKAKKAKKATRTGKAKTKASRKRSSVKLPAKKAATVRGGLPAVQKVREAAAQQESLPTEQVAFNYAKVQS